MKPICIVFECDLNHGNKVILALISLVVLRAVGDPCEAVVHWERQCDLQEYTVRPWCQRTKAASALWTLCVTEGRTPCLLLYAEGHDPVHGTFMLESRKQWGFTSIAKF